MKKGLLLILVALACLFFAMPNNKDADAAGEVTWELVKDASNLTVGDQVIIAAKDTAVALSTTQNSNNRDQANITKSGDTISAPGSDVQVLTLQAGKSSGTFALYTGKGYLYAASSSKNYLRTETTLSGNSSWKITVTSNGVATIKAQGTNTRNTIYYNKASSLFSAYSSAQQSVVIYKKVEAGAEVVPQEPTEVTNYDSTLGTLFNKYYNIGGSETYTKETSIYVNLDSATFKNELSSLVHAYDATNKVELSKTTFYSGENLWFADGHGYGTSTDGNLTSIDNTTGEFIQKYVHSTLPGMEEYYLTLKDFIDGEHISAHTGNKELDLTSGWKELNGVYSNENADVIAAFVLFTAPTWLNLDKDNKYIDYAKVTVEEDDNKLVMKLWVSATEAEGKLTSKAEGEYALFSSAVISKKQYEVSGKLATFTFGKNGAAIHKDGSKKDTYSETNNGYTLTLTKCSYIYLESYDAQGTSCLKLGTGDYTGAFTFSVPEEVTEVVIYVAQYKSYETKVTVNGVTYEIKTASNNGDYTALVIDTTSVKTVSFTTVSDYQRCMINSILFN